MPQGLVSIITLKSFFVFGQSYPNQFWIVGKSLGCSDVVSI